MLPACAALVAACVFGCDGSEQARGGPTGGEGEPAVRVVATTGMIADVAREVGGERVRVTGLMGEGVDPHLYKASPGDLRAMSDAGLVLYNGLHLEGRMADVIERMGGRTSVVRVTEGIEPALLLSKEGYAGHPDPHVWFDVSLWSKVVGRVRDALSARDPAGRESYEKSAAAYAAVLGELHGYAHSTVAGIPADRRVLVTAHDAFGYFSRAYGIEVLAIQGISTDSEASLRDINGLVDTLVSRKIPAVFIESSVPRKTVDALVEGCGARGHKVAVGGELFSDSMGREGTAEGTYVGMVLHNVETIAKALGGRVPERRPERIEEFLKARKVEKSDTHGKGPRG
ncbi:MAG: metal ABC transporter solute-binding protein, Zn/Mn family [Phycisphaerales bacterium]